MPTPGVLNCGFDNGAFVLYTVSVFTLNQSHDAIRAIRDDCVEL